MRKFNVGDEITSTEQIEELPVGTILKLVAKNGGHMDVGAVRNSFATGRTKIEALEQFYRPHEYPRLLEIHVVTVVDLPKRKWKVGDVLHTAEELEEQAIGVVVETGRSASAGVYRRSANCWFSTLDGCNYESEALARLQPLTIIRIPEN